jgi:AcrR family transcriptional regulator
MTKSSSLKVDTNAIEYSLNMASKSKIIPIAPELGRKSAYVARNRAALIRAAQHVFAETGPTATMEAVAAYAEVAPSTVYKHFETKENLLSLALLEAFSQWSEWAQTLTAKTADPLTRLVLPMRLFVRLRTTHPLFAQLVKSCFGEVHKIVAATNTGFAEELRHLRDTKVLVIDNLEIRVMNHGSVLTGIIEMQLNKPDSTDDDADTAIEIALGMLCISAAKAKKIAHSPLPRLLS